MKTNLVIRLVTVVAIALALFILPQLWDFSGLPIVVIAAVLVLTFFLVRWHANHTGYQCLECRHTFAIGPITDFLSPHLSGVKMLRCPQCGASSWCEEIERSQVRQGPAAIDKFETAPVQKSGSLTVQIVFVLIIYTGLWVYTFWAWPGAAAGVSYWTVLKIPLVTFILPVLQLTFCLYALRHGYRSRIYLFVSLFVIVFLLLAIWMQRTILMQL